MSEWISVRDRLPGENVRVIAWTGRLARFAIYSGGLWFFEGEATRYGPHLATHWMPGPKGPDSA